MLNINELIRLSRREHHNYPAFGQLLRNSMPCISIAQPEVYESKLG